MSKQLAVFLVLASFLQSLDCGNVLFFMPVIPKSSKITWFPLAMQLADRGHMVTIVNPYASKESYPNIEEIIVESAFDNYTNEISSQILQGELFSMCQISTLQIESFNTQAT